MWELSSYYILITITTIEEHLRNMDKVLCRLQTAGLRLKSSKCLFMAPSVEYLGRIIDSAGLHLIMAKVKAFTQAPAPRNVTELRSFLGLINYYGKFLPNLSLTLAPLHKLLQQNTQWHWSDSQVIAFNATIKALQSSALLVDYDGSKPLTLECNASPHGVGEVLSHRFEDRSEKPTGFSTQTLSTTEKNYSQLDKEALAIIFGEKKFHDYLHGHHFTIYSYHQPLQHLFSEQNRSRRWLQAD